MQNSHFNERNISMDLGHGERLIGIKAGVDNWNEVAQLQFMTLRNEEGQGRMEWTEINFQIYTYFI